jgi:predicted amidophosphoribosyltransferase
MVNSDERKLGKEQCSECQQWVKEVDEENGLCGKCLKKFE